MKNPCSSRAKYARSKNVLAKPALTSPAPWLALQFDFRYDAITTFGRYEPELSKAVASRMVMFIESGYAHPVEFFIENLGTCHVSGDPAFFTLMFASANTDLDISSNWREIQFAVVLPDLCGDTLDFEVPQDFASLMLVGLTDLELLDATV